MSLCGFGTPEFCSLYSDKHFAIKVKRGMCLFWASCHQHWITRWFMSDSAQWICRVGNSLTGLGACDLWAVINYSCRDSCTGRFSSHPAVVGTTESQPDTPSSCNFCSWNLQCHQRTFVWGSFKWAALSQSKVFFPAFQHGQKSMWQSSACDWPFLCDVPWNGGDTTMPPCDRLQSSSSSQN